MADENESPEKIDGEQPGTTKVRRIKSRKSDKESTGERKKVSVKRSTPVASPDLSAETASPASTPTPTPTSTPTPSSNRPPSKKRATRSGSNVFAMFTPNQVAQFKEAFSFIDQDKDGIISKNDIRASFDALGRLCSDNELNQMLSEASGPINFTMFLTIFGDRAQGTDDEDVIMDAFSRYDEGEGFCQEKNLRHALMTWGEKFSEKECDVALAEASIDSRGRIDIKKLATLITRGTDDDDQEA
ncbi:hypothetical protein GZH46_02298 [Fragariocoptes setiger]|uniref:EF-hand domain-containing protein n=1 Tax=Fragariocoptes setiger TaxID=1670756 RepID=A0ABQ7S6Z5_9ACAR|nr:hypothetical protein GZH46_02298 [Fragariocoptes setiger]